MTLFVLLAWAENETKAKKRRIIGNDRLNQETLQSNISLDSVCESSYFRKNDDLGMDQTQNFSHKVRSDSVQPDDGSQIVEGSFAHIAQLDQSAQAASDLLKALASPNRLKILCCLVKGEKSVGQIATQVGIREAATSQHLSLLRKDRLVMARRAGQTIYYRLDSPVAEKIIAILYEHFCPQAVIGVEDVESPCDEVVSGEKT
ncbi:ArsR family transcriptional regulator, virulence genes transcriptional regulator [Azospirillaceae bacterium]